MGLKVKRTKERWRLNKKSCEYSPIEPRGQDETLKQTKNLEIESMAESLGEVDISNTEKGKNQL